MSIAKALIPCAAIVFATTISQARAEDFKYRPWLPGYLEYVACIYDNAGVAHETSQAGCKSSKEKMLNQLQLQSTALKIKDLSKAENFLEYLLKWVDKKPRLGSLDTKFEGFEHLTANYLRCVSRVIADDADFKAGKKINPKLATNFCKDEFSAVVDSMQSAKLRRRARKDVGHWRDWIKSSGIEYGQFGDGIMARHYEPLRQATYTGEQ